ncbi:unnamed protein product [Periconia digitata]|uniref:Cyanovirin-N domain-containing protein n=1 Tax=Periconia digitata TaxID=1303443 RepID=A0A9W4U6P2_9PLEO|nr:unnamed protein product [Periconia digitata]
MVCTSALTAFAALLSGAAAAPSLAARAGTIASQCTNVRITSQRWLVGDCLTGTGSTRITSGTYLPNKIGNDDGNLKWTENGVYYVTCAECKLVDGGSSLTCQCRPNFGERKETTLKLDEHISVYSGHLLSNLKGAPAVPKAPSRYPFPSNFAYGLGGNATCVPGSDRPDWCQSVAYQCSNQDKTDFSETASIRYDFPHGSCFQASYWFDDKFQFDKVKIATAEGAWQLTGYTDSACGQEVVQISPEELGKCKSTPQLAKSFKVVPLFNGDPN